MRLVHAQLGVLKWRIDLNRLTFLGTKSSAIRKNATPILLKVASLMFLLIKMQKTSEKQIELNPEFKKAFELMENSGKNVFVTGKAGTGKSTLLKYFRENTAKEVVVLAPTGVAALNVEGQTIHSFFKFNIDITPTKVKKLSELQRELYGHIDTIVIDEVSMVRADLMDCVDKFLRLN